MNLYNAVMDPFDFAGVRGKDAQKKAQKAQQEAAQLMASSLLEAVDRQIAYQTAAEKRAYEHVKPWRESGVSALDEIGRYLEEDTGPGEFETSPGYEWRVGEGEEAIDRMASSRGKFFSPSTGKALVEHGQDVATGEYDSFLRRYYQKKGNTLDPYMKLAGLGQGSADTAAASSTAMGANAPDFVGATGLGQQALTSAASNRASGYINTYNQQQQKNTGILSGILSAIL